MSWHFIYAIQKYVSVYIFKNFGLLSSLEPILYHHNTFTIYVYCPLKVSCVKNNKQYLFPLLCAKVSLSHIYMAILSVVTLSVGDERQTDYSSREPSLLL